MSTFKSKTKSILATTLEAKRTTWVVENICACGKVTVIASEPGAGASLFAIDLIARVSSGSDFPLAIGSVTSGAVMFLSDETDFAECGLPRLAAANADLEKVHYVRFDEKITKEHLSELLATAPWIDLVVLDTRIDPKCDMVALIDDLRDLAVKKKFAVLLVMSLPLGAAQAGQMISKLVQSKASVVSTLCREEGTVRTLVPRKNTLAPDNAAYAFTVSTSEMEGGLRIPHIEWESSVAPAVIQSTSRRSYADRRAACAKFAKENVKDGTLSRDVAKLAMEAGHNIDMVNDEAMKQGFRRKREGGLAAAGCWVWRKEKQSMDKSK